MKSDEWKKELAKNPGVPVAGALLAATAVAVAASRTAQDSIKAAWERTSDSISSGVSEKVQRLGELTAQARDVAHEESVAFREERPREEEPAVAPEPEIVPVALPPTRLPLVFADANDLIFWLEQRAPRAAGTLANDLVYNQSNANLQIRDEAGGITTALELFPELYEPGSVVIGAKSYPTNVSRDVLLARDVAYARSRPAAAIETPAPQATTTPAVLPKEPSDLDLIRDAFLRGDITWMRGFFHSADQRIQRAIGRQTIPAIWWAIRTAAEAAVFPIREGGEAIVEQVVGMLEERLGVRFPIGASSKEIMDRGFDILLNDPASIGPTQGGKDAVKPASDLLGWIYSKVFR